MAAAGSCSGLPQWVSAEARADTDSVIEVCARHQIKWMPVKIAIVNGKKNFEQNHGGYTAKMCDFYGKKEITSQEIARRQARLHTHGFEHIAIDTTTTIQLDVDDTAAMAHPLIKQLLGSAPFYLSAAKGLPHIFVRVEPCPTQKRSVARVFGEAKVEVLAGQWAWAEKGAVVYGASRAIPTVKAADLSVAEVEVAGSKRGRALEPGSSSEPMMMKKKKAEGGVALAVPPPVKVMTPELFDRVVGAISELPSSEATEYDPWIRMVFAIARVRWTYQLQPGWAERLKELAHAFSQKCGAKYDEKARKDVDKVFAEQANVAKALGLRYIFDRTKICSGAETEEEQAARRKEREARASAPEAVSLEAWLRQSIPGYGAAEIKDVLRPADGWPDTRLVMLHDIVASCGRHGAYFLIHRDGSVTERCRGEGCTHRELDPKLPPWLRDGLFPASPGQDHSADGGAGLEADEEVGGEGGEAVFSLPGQGAGDDGSDTAAAAPGASSGGAPTAPGAPVKIIHPLISAAEMEYIVNIAVPGHEKTKLEKEQDIKTDKDVIRAVEAKSDGNFCEQIGRAHDPPLGVTFRASWVQLKEDDQGRGGRGRGRGGRGSCRGGRGSGRGGRGGQADRRCFVTLTMHCNHPDCNKQKPVHTYPVPEGTIAYNLEKKDFEETHFRVNHPIGYCVDRGDEVTFMSEKKFKETYRPKQKVNVGEGMRSFVEVWMSDPSARNYDELDFLPPPLEKPERTYNTWKGFAAEKLESVAGASARPFEEHVRMLCGAQAVGEYVIQWLAHVIQKPGERADTYLQLEGEQGTGKGTIFEHIMPAVIGLKHCAYSTDPEQIFGRFSQCQNNKVLLVMDDMSIQKLQKYMEPFKTLVTSARTVYESKGVDQVWLNNLVNVVICSNKHVPIPPGRRTGVVVRCNEERKDDKAYFNMMTTYRNDPRNIRAIYDWLKAYPLTMDLRHDRPRTEARDQASQAAASPMLLFLASLTILSRTEAAEIQASADAHAAESISKAARMGGSSAELEQFNARWGWANDVTHPGHRALTDAERTERDAHVDASKKRYRDLLRVMSKQWDETGWKDPSPDRVLSGQTHFVLESGLAVRWRLPPNTPGSPACTTVTIEAARLYEMFQAWWKDSHGSTEEPPNKIAFGRWISRDGPGERGGVVRNDNNNNGAKIRVDFKQLSIYLCNEGITDLGLVGRGADLSQAGEVM